jgi:putative flippase GtrA
MSGKSLKQRCIEMFPRGQLVPYLCVGVFNTVFGYVTYVVALTLLNGALPQRLLYLTVVLASLIVTPVNITVAFLGYKFFVFRTKGHFLREWLKCFALYGAGWVPGLFALSALTRLLQSIFHRYAVPLRSLVAAVETHLGGPPLRWLQHAANGKAAAGYVAGALLTVFATVYSFLGHKHITFNRRVQKPSPVSDRLG